MVKRLMRRRCLALFLTVVLSLSLAPAVWAANVAGIEVALDHNTLTLSAGMTGELTPTVTATYDDNNTGDITRQTSFSWESSNDAIARVSGSTSGEATVTGVSAGTATVTVTATYTGDDGTKHEEKVSCTVTVEAAKAISITTASPLRTGKGLTTPVRAATNPAGQTVAWKSDDTSVATVDNYSSVLTAHKPGTTKVYAYLESDPEVVSEGLEVIVSGIEVLEDPFQVDENGTADLTDAVKCHGDARVTTLSFNSPDSYTIEVVGNQVRGLNVGEATVEVRANGGAYIETIRVEVVPDPTTELKAPDMTTADTLSFSSLNFAGQINNTVAYVTGLLVPTNQGTLYYKYRSEAEPGPGVGQVESYYRSPGPGQRALNDVTFVPKADYPGGQVTISYTAVTTEGRNYACKITFMLKSGSGNGSQVEGIIFSTAYNTAVKFDGLEFDQVCREQTGSRLSYVTFSQPPVRQGSLYTNYTNSGNYGSPVELRRHYSQKDLDDVWFVPAPGYSGSAVVYYTGAGTNGRTYSGQVLINVEQEGGVAIGGLHYETVPGQAVRFDDEDFSDYCRELLDQYQTLSFVRFESMPGESEGVLYYDYRSSTNTGSRVVEGTTYYYGTRSPRIDRLTFVPAKDFTGTVRIPFTGQTVDGTRFSGNVEINVRSGIGSGDIYYTCAPGRSVSFRTSDFTGLSRDLTGNTLDYIQFQGLPNSADGSLYHNNTRISATGTRYYNSSGASRISNLSFRASSSFSGTVDIPFIGTDRRGNTFNAVVTISDSSSGNSGSSSGGDIRYTTDYNTAVVFDRDDFDDLSQWETDRNVSSVRFTPPLSSEGSLYRNYRSSSNMGTRITSNTTVNASELDRVAFVPASGFSGTAYIDFTANASGSGGSFTGSVEVVVGRDYSSGYSSAYFSDMNGYSAAQQRAVDFLYDRGITRGLTTGQYGPESHIRRGDFARMVYIAFGMTPSANTSAFQDVPAGIYYAEAVNALAARGVVSGTGGGLFSPDSALTRQDAVCMVQRAMRAVGREAGDGSTGALSGYSDWINISGYAQGAMSFAVQRGYLPTAGGRLSPTQPLTRVDMAEIIYRVLTY